MSVIFREKDGIETIIYHRNSKEIRYENRVVLPWIFNCAGLPAALHPCPVAE
jgi:hypothetical protein